MANKRLFIILKRFLKRSNGWIVALTAAISTLISLLFSKYIVVLLALLDFSLLSLPFSKSELSLVDVYQVILGKQKNNMPQYEDPDIVIINMQDADRETIALTVEQLMAFAPKAVGVDFTFPKARFDESDSILKRAFNRENIVVGCKLIVAQDNRSFIDKQSGFFVEETEKVKEGFTNIISGKADPYTRIFFPVELYGPVNHKDTVFSLAAALAIQYDPAFKDKLTRIAGQSQTVNFAFTTFQEILYTDIQRNADIIRDKIALVGCVGCADDLIATLYDENMSGVVLHAHILSTIIHDKYIKDLPLGAFSSVLLYFLFALVYLKVFYFLQTKTFYTVSFRVVQLSISSVILLVGYYLFVRNHTHINIYVGNLLIVGVITDFAYGLVKLFQYITKKTNL